MESRALRYFVAVAEELNFTRAAQRLGMASPPLSRAIRKLEADLGVTLFERSTRSVALTAAGTVLLDQARIALETLHAARRRTQRAAVPDPKLVLAVKADNDAGLLDGILSRYAAEPAAQPVTVHLCGWGEQPRLLRQGDADVALIYEPFDHTGLDVEPIVTEPWSAALAANHPLADRRQLRLNDLRFPIPEPAHPHDLQQYLDQTAAAHQIRDLAQLLKLVEMGSIVYLLPQSVSLRYPRPGLSYHRVIDAPAATLTVAWPQRSRSLAVAALVRTAASVAADSPLNAARVDNATA